MKKQMLFAIALGLMALNVGCSSQGDITDVSVKAKKYSLGQQSGIISGSHQNEQTVNGYTVSGSVGAWTDKIQQTSSNGYRVYSSVQGNMASETFKTVVVE